VEDSVIDNIIMNSKKQIAWARQFKKHRYLFEEIGKIDKEYFVGVKGMRGIGKTVMILQVADETKDVVYFSADSTALKSYSLYEIINELVKRDFKNIFIDEIHRKPDWDKDIKTIYDEHTARIVFTGSSALDITRTSADLSRRVVLKELLPTSFREFLNIRKDKSIEPVKFKNILKDKNSLVKKYSELYEYYDEFLEYGGMLYPKSGFFDALANSLRKVILQDLLALRDINVKYETDIYKLLHLIAKSPPFELNYSTIANKLDISKTLAIRIVNDLESSGVIKVVFPCMKKGIDVKKEPKLYLTIPLRKLFSKEGIPVEKGALREEFFVNHVRNVCYLKGERGEKTPDFRCEDVVIEIGGESKTKYQGADFIAVDGLSTADNKVPLFLFGFVY